MTKEEKIKEGTTLVAIDVCKMNGSDEESLTIGKKYNVLSVDYENREFVIIDDVLSEHYFDIDEYEEFFNLNNNGWIKIESEDDLPKDETMYWASNNNHIYNHCYSKDEFLEDYSKDKKLFTHYQPIEKPKPPLY